MTKKKRAEDDFYATPPKETRAFLQVFAPTLKVAPARILEPAAGDGAMLAELRAWWPAAACEGYDLTPRDDGRHGIHARIFWFDDEPGALYDLVITNPPFEWAQGFASYGLQKLAKGGVLALLLPMAFLNSQIRKKWLYRHKPSDLWPISARPSFDGEGTDMRDVAWVVWREGRRPKFTRCWPGVL